MAAIIRTRDEEEGAVLSVIRTAVVIEREIFRRGVTACLAEDPAIVVVSNSYGGILDEVDLVVASNHAASVTAWGVPLVVFAEAGWTGEDSVQDPVLAVLPWDDLEPEQLLGAVHAAAAGLRIEMASPEHRCLDFRQVAVLGLLADGAATRDICDELGYSDRTIKTVIRDVESYLEARTRAEAVAKAIRLGII